VRYVGPDCFRGGITGGGEDRHPGDNISDEFFQWFHRVDVFVNDLEAFADMAGDRDMCPLSPDIFCFVFCFDEAEAV